MIGLGPNYKVIEFLFGLNGRNVGAELDRMNDATGLYPFMNAAVSTQCKLTDVYMMMRKKRV